MTRVLRVINVAPAHPSRQERGWEARNSTVKIAIDLGLKTEQVGIIEMSETEAAEFIERLVVATGQARRVNSARGDPA